MTKPTWTDDDVVRLFGVLQPFFVLVCMGFLFLGDHLGHGRGIELGKNEADIVWQKRLAEEGLGRWAVDEKTGAREFKVGPPTQEKP